VGADNASDLMPDGTIWYPHHTWDHQFWKHKNRVLV